MTIATLTETQGWIIAISVAILAILGLFAALRP
jgi:hypothetical protein